MVTKTITNRNWQVLYSGLRAIGGLKCSVNFAIAIAKNMRIIKNELLEDMEAVMKPSKEYMKYNTELLKLAEKHAKKDVEGRPMKKDQNNFLMVDQAKFDAEKEILKNSKEHKETVDEREAKIEEFEDKLQEKTTLELSDISQSELPEGITPGQLEGIFDIISDDKPKSNKSKKK